MSLPGVDTASPANSVDAGAASRTDPPHDLAPAPPAEAADQLARSWQAVQERLHAAVPPATYAMWFAELQPVALEGDPPTLELSAPSQYVARTLTGRYFGVLQEAAQGPLGPGAALAVRIASIDPDGAGDDHGTSASDAG